MTYKELLALAQKKEREYSYVKSNVLALKMKFLEEARERGQSCERCKGTQELTVDHIVPMDFLNNLGYDKLTFWDEENMTILCRRCNGFKGNRLDFSEKKTKKLLLKYLNLIEE